MKKILFRADAGSTIGYGHFIRTLALADMLKDEFDCYFATVRPTPFQTREMNRICKTITLPEGDLHYDYFLSLLKGTEIVVLDNYFFSEAYQLRIKEIGCKLVCIDDLHDKHFYADIVINHALGVTPDDYSGESGTKYLLGFKFALLRREYLFEKKPKKQKRYGCLILMGGADPLHITLTILNIMESLEFEQPIAVIVGDGYKDESSLMAKNWVTLYKGITGAEVYELMQDSSFGIFPASTSAIEACAARLPFICGYYVENQKDIYNGLKNHGLAICIGHFENLQHKIIENAIHELLQKEVRMTLSKKQAAILDKGSKKRFLDAFKQL